MRHIESTTPPPPRLRPRWLYRLAYVWAGIGVAWILISGRLVSYFAAFFTIFKETARGTNPATIPTSEFNSLSLTAGLWLVFITPLMLLAFDLGMQHAQARRVHTSLWRGLRETWRAAWQHVQLDKMALEFARAPGDDSSAAILRGVGAAVLPFAFFLFPQLRTVSGVVWISGVGILLGIMAYSHRRAAAYLSEEPSRWNILRQYNLLNPSRYEPAGRPFVRVQIVCLVLLPMWWLGGGVLVMSRLAA